MALLDRRISASGGDLLSGRDGNSLWASYAWLALRLVLGLVLLAIPVTSILIVRYTERTYGVPFSAIPERAARIGLIDLETNARGGDRSPAGLARWQAAALRAGLELEYRAVANFDELVHDRYCALVLPGQERLSDAQWEQALALARSGLGLVLTGHPGRLDETGRTRDRPLLADLVPGEHLYTLPRAGGVLRIAAPGPLVASFAPGELLALDAERAVLALRATSSLTWGAEGGPHPTGDAALLATAVDTTPLLWIGLRADEFVDDEQAEALLANLLRYAAREPLAELRPWPAGAPAAALVEAGPAELANLAESGFASAQLTQQGVGSESERGADPDRLLGRLLKEFARVEREGGLYAVPHAALAGDGLTEVRANLRAELQQRRTWLPDAVAAADWWAQRAELELRLERPRAGLARLSLHNRSKETAIENATARVYLPSGARVPTRIEDPPLLGGPALRVGSDRRWIDVITRELEPGERVTYSFRY